MFNSNAVVRPINVSKPPDGRKDWKEDNYRAFHAACDIKQFSQPASSPTLYFHTRNQFDFFCGIFEHAAMNQNKLSVHWNYLNDFEHIRPLLAKVEQAGLRDIMRLKQNWNEAVVRQFYATLEVNMEKESIKWMTGKGKFKASFREFAAACGLDYDSMKEGAQMKSLPKIKEGEARRCHKWNEFKFTFSSGLRREPHLLNRMLRCTVMPKGGDAGRICLPYYIAIRAIMDGVKVN